MNLNLYGKIKFYKPFGYFDYMKLQKESELVISDSGSITEEAQILDLKAINIRYAHERMEGMDCGSVIMSNLSKRNLLNAINLELSHTKFQKIKTEFYFREEVSTHICKIIQSYTEYIDKKNWFK